MKGLKTVFVLGGGFSRTLGAPILTTLLSEAGQRRIHAAFPSYPKLYDACATRIRRVFVEDQSKGRERQWDDAEDFLAQLDAAAEHGDDSPEARLFKPFLGGDHPLQAFQAAARRLVAAECSAFLEGIDPRLPDERWGPYKAWAKFVDTEDAIITFNYDRVLEKLIEYADKPTFSIAHPESGPVDGLAPVFKLHGSVDWSLDAQTGLVTVPEKGKENPVFALTCPDENICIASPGPSKAKKTESFVALWEDACTALAEAEQVVFMGYRFPVTDTEAAQRLLGAIADNAAGVIDRRTHTLGVKIVLGSDRASIDRLAALLEGAGVGGTVGVVDDTKFYATDYMLTVARP